MGLEHTTVMGANWQDLAPAYALGMLEPQEAAQFEQQLLIDAELRVALQRYQEVVDELPLAIAPVVPPPMLKDRLMAMVQPPVQARPVPAKPTRNWFSLGQGWSLLARGALVAAALAIAVLSGALLNTTAQLRQVTSESARLTEQVAATEQLVTDLRREQQALNANLAAARQNEQRLSSDLSARAEQLQQVEAQIETNQHTLAFLAANDLAARPMSSSATNKLAEGTMFMRPGDAEAVVLVRGLPALDRSQTYQFWLAEGTQQVNAGVLTINADGTGRLVFNAPGPVDRFAQIMVTVEQDSLATEPSKEVILQGSLV